MLNCGSKAHKGGIYLNGYMIQKGEISKFFGQENRQLPKSPLEVTIWNGARQASGVEKYKW